MALSDEDFCQQLMLASEHCLGSLSLQGQRVKTPLSQAHSEDYVQNGVALIGDAAHTIHPLAGQGVNLGFSDVVALVAELQHGYEKGLAINHLSTLKRYQRQRKPENLMLEKAMSALKNLFERQDLPSTLLRSGGMQLFNKIPSLKHTLIKQAMGIP